MQNDNHRPVSRRALLRFIGATGGSALMYDTMVAMGYTGTSDFNGPIKLSGDVKGASVLILGAGLAGMTAAYELRKAGYKVQILEYNDRPGGRNWSLYGGDSYTDIGGVTQNIKFAKGLYFNPGPWRLPHHHHAILYYCKLFNVTLETFTMTNYNAYIHSTKAFGGKPIRRREIDGDFSGYVAELLAKAASQNKLDQPFTKDEKDGLLQTLRFWGALDKNYEYKKGPIASELRGYAVDPGGGLSPAPVDSDPLPMKQLFTSDMWTFFEGRAYDYQTQLFEPVGGMGMIGKAFGQQLNGSDQIQLQGHQHSAGRQRRHRHLYRFEKGRRAADGSCGLVCLHHPGVGAQSDSVECGRADEERDQFAVLRIVIQGWFAIQAPLLGRG